MPERLPENEYPINQLAKQFLLKEQGYVMPEKLYILDLVGGGENLSAEEDIMVGSLLGRSPKAVWRFLASEGGLGEDLDESYLVSQERLNEVKSSEDLVKLVVQRIMELMRDFTQ